MLKLDIALTARADLREIRIYSKAVFGPSVARTYLDGLRNAVTRLQEHPLLGAPADDVREGLRGLAYRSHHIYYRVTPDSVLIVRILHHARDASSALGRGT